LITVRLIGGLGNQMFQYAVGRRLSLERGVPLSLDLGWFGHQSGSDTPRSYELGCFVADEHVRKVEVDLPEPSNRVELLRARLHDRFGRRRTVVRQRGPEFDPAVLAVGDTAHLIGFWQSERFFGAAADTIRADFRLNQPLSPQATHIDEQIARQPSVSLHVRRGDYVTNAAAKRFHGTMQPGYYRAGLDAIQEPEAHAFVFSDDPAWCEAELALGRPMTVIGGDGRPAVEDMVLMSRCDHHVIANSSFSWWGAWLDPRPAGVVVAPARWALDEKADFSDVYADGWLRI
jgi:hypothetical protein